ncbi:MAG: hypothetical protein JWQ85_968 [Mucilaginibacter sp.]|nr:hypothetical protein [Mucilaginibacter sp.]
MYNSDLVLLYQKCKNGLKHPMSRRGNPLKGVECY